MNEKFYKKDVVIPTSSSEHDTIYIKQCLMNLAKRAVPNERGTIKQCLTKLAKRAVPNELGTTRRSLQFNGQPIRRARLSHQCLDALCIRLD